MNDDLAIMVVREWNDRLIDGEIEEGVSFDHYVKTRYPKSYDRIIKEVKYNGYLSRRESNRRRD